MLNYKFILEYIDNLLAHSLYCLRKRRTDLKHFLLKNIYDMVLNPFVLILLGHLGYLRVPLNSDCNETQLITTQKSFSSMHAAAVVYLLSNMVV